MRLTKKRGNFESEEESKPSRPGHFKIRLKHQKSLRDQRRLTVTQNAVKDYRIMLV